MKWVYGHCEALQTWNDAQTLEKLFGGLCPEHPCSPTTDHLLTPFEVKRMRDVNSRGHTENRDTVTIQILKTTGRKYLSLHSRHLIYLLLTNQQKKNDARVSNAYQQAIHIKNIDGQ